MFRPVVQQMAALAQGPDVAVPAPAMGWVVVEVGRREHDLGRADRRVLGQGRRGDLAATAVAPGLPPLA